MVKVKNVVAVAIMFIAGGAMASNFRAADQVYVPAAGHLSGAAAHSFPMCSFRISLATPSAYP